MIQSDSLHALLWCVFMCNYRYAFGGNVGIDVDSETPVGLSRPDCCTCLITNLSILKDLCTRQQGKAGKLHGRRPGGHVTNSWKIKDHTSIPLAWFEVLCIYMHTFLCLWQMYINNFYEKTLKQKRIT